MSTYKINDCCNASTAEIKPKTTMKFEDYIIDELRNGKSMDEIMKYISDRANAAESTFKAEQNKKKSPWDITNGGDIHPKINDALTRFREGNAIVEDFIILLIEGLYQIIPAMRSALDEIDINDNDINILVESMYKELNKMDKLLSVAKTFDDDKDKIAKFLNSLSLL